MKEKATTKGRSQQHHRPSSFLAKLPDSSPASLLISPSRPLPLWLARFCPLGTAAAPFSRLLVTQLAPAWLRPGRSSSPSTRPLTLSSSRARLNPVRLLVREGALGNKEMRLARDRREKKNETMVDETSYTKVSVPGTWRRACSVYDSVHTRPPPRHSLPPSKRA